MKSKFLLLACLSFFLVSSMYAQNNMNGVASTINQRNNSLSRSYGVKMGVNLSNMSSDMSFDPNFSMGTGFQIGFFYNLHWGVRTVNSAPGTGWLGLQPELLFSSQKVKCEDGNITMNYVKLPLMLKVYPISALSIELGPELAYLLSASPSSVKVDGATVAVGDCKGLDLGLGIGAAYELDCGLVVGARYSIGTKDLGENLKWKNKSNIQITAGWLF